MPPSRPPSPDRRLRTSREGRRGARERDRRRGFLVLATFGSLGLHATVVVALLNIEPLRRNRAEDFDLQPIEWLEPPARAEGEDPPPLLTNEPHESAQDPARPVARTHGRRSRSGAGALRVPVQSGLAIPLRSGRNTDVGRGTGARSEPALITSDPGALAAIPLRLRPEGPQPEGPPPHASDRIVELANGNLGYTDPGGRFNAYIRPDGSVRFVDSKNASAKVCVAFVCVGGGAVRPVVAGGKERHHTLGVDFAPVPLGAAALFGRQVGTERLETEFLQRTFDMRMKMSLRWQRQQIEGQLAALEDQLEDVWKDARNVAPGVRREVFVQLWEECEVAERSLPPTASKLPHELYEARHRAALRARKIIERFYEERSGEPLH